MTTDDPNKPLYDSLVTYFDSSMHQYDLNPEQARKWMDNLQQHWIDLKAQVGDQPVHITIIGEPAWVRRRRASRLDRPAPFAFLGAWVDVRQTYRFVNGAYLVGMEGL